MDRRSFIKNGCAACLGATGFAVLLISCKSSQLATGKLVKDGLLMDLDQFQIKGTNKHYTYVVVRPEELLFPICVFRHSATAYTALWMQCTHQGAELNVVGDQLECPAHGSEFSMHGAVLSGPADKALRSFPVTLTNNELFIDLRKS